MHVQRTGAHFICKQFGGNMFETLLITPITEQQYSDSDESQGQNACKNNVFVGYAV